MGYRLNRLLDEPVLMTGPKPVLTEFGIYYRLERCSVITFVQRRGGIRSWVREIGATEETRVSPCKSTIVCLFGPPNV